MFAVDLAPPAKGIAHEPDDNVEVRGAIAFTWIKRVRLTCGYFGGGKTMSFELERRLQMGEAVRGMPLLPTV